MPAVTRKISSTRQMRREAIVAQMLEATESLLSEGENFTKLSVARLIGAAGISRSTFYVYFDDKGALLLAFADDIVQQLLGAAGAWWALPDGAGREDVEGALRNIIDVFLTHAAIWGALVDASSYDTKVRESFREVVDGAAAGLARHIQHGQKAGAIRPSLDPKRTAEWLTWMTERGLHQLVGDASPTEVEKLCQAQTDIVWCTLYEGAERSSASSQ